MAALHAKFSAVPTTDVNGGMSALFDTAITTGVGWIQFGDGTMICWGGWATSSGTAGTNTNFFGTTSGTTYYRYMNVSFPKHFTTLDAILTACIFPATWELTTLDGFLNTVRYGADPTGYNCTWLAIGKWK
jgi:hypothetical protein